MPKHPYKNLHLTKEDYLVALSEEEGNEYAAYHKIGLPFNRLLQWKEEDEEFAKSVEKIQNQTKKWVENKMFEMINGEIGDANIQARMVQFYLKTAGGYNETKNINANVSGSNTVDLNVVLDEIKKDLETNN